MLFTWVKKINGPVEYNDNYRDKITDMAFNRRKKKPSVVPQAVLLYRDYLAKSSKGKGAPLKSSIIV